MYYVLFVEDSEPKTIEKDTLEEVGKFLTSFVSKYGSLDDGDSNWIDQIFEGRKVNFSLEIKLNIDDNQVVS